MLDGSIPAALQRSKVSLRLSPASTRRRVEEVATKVQLPALEDARTETCTMARSLSAYFIRRRPPMHAFLKQFFEFLFPPFSQQQKRERRRAGQVHGSGLRRCRIEIERRAGWGR